MPKPWITKITVKLSSQTLEAILFTKGKLYINITRSYTEVSWPTVRLLRRFSDAFSSHGCVRVQQAAAKKLFEHSVDKKTIVEVI